MVLFNLKCINDFKGLAARRGCKVNGPGVRNNAVLCESPAPRQAAD